MRQDLLPLLCYGILRQSNLSPHHRMHSARNNDNLTEWYAGDGLGSHMHHEEADVKLPLFFLCRPVGPPSALSPRSSSLGCGFDARIRAVFARESQAMQNIWCRAGVHAFSSLRIHA